MMAIGRKAEGRITVSKRKRNKESKENKSKKGKNIDDDNALLST